LLVRIVLHESWFAVHGQQADEHTKVIEGGGDYRKVHPLGYIPALVLEAMAPRPSFPLISNARLPSRLTPAG
jgi:hypothetical protein